MAKMLIKEVTIEGYGSFHIRRPSAASRLEMAQRQADPDVPEAVKNLEILTLAVLYCVVDENGNRRYANEQIDEVRELDAALIDELAGKILEHGGGPTQAKNSPPSPSESSPTG